MKFTLNIFFYLLVGINNGKPLIGFIDPVGKVFVPDFLIPKILAQHVAIVKDNKLERWVASGTMWGQFSE